MRPLGLSRRTWKEWFSQESRPLPRHSDRPLSWVASQSQESFRRTRGSSREKSGLWVAVAMSAHICRYPGSRPSLRMKLSKRPAYLGKRSWNAEVGAAAGLSVMRPKTCWADLVQTFFHQPGSSDHFVRQKPGQRQRWSLGFGDAGSGFLSHQPHAWSTSSRSSWSEPLSSVSSAGSYLGRVWWCNSIWGQKYP